MGKQKTLADWIWLAIGIAGLMCIGFAVYMFVTGARAPTPEEAARIRVEMAEKAWVAGRKLLSEGDYEGAVEQLKAAVSAPEMFAEPRLQNDLGVALDGSGKAREAVEAWHNSRKLAPTYCPPYLNLGKHYAKADVVEEALHHFRAGAAFLMGPVPKDLEQRISELEEKAAGRFADDRAELARSFAANPANPGALAGLVLLRLRAIDCPADAPPTDGIRYAVLAAGDDVSELDRLLERQRSAVGDRPGSVVDRSGLGAVHLLRGDFDRAQVVFGEALKLSGTDVMSILGVALADLLCGAEGEARMETAVTLLRGNPLPWIVLGAGFLSHDKGEPARQALVNAIRLNPALPEVCRLVALSFTEPEREKEKEVYLRAYRRLLK